MVRTRSPTTRAAFRVRTASTARPGSTRRQTGSPSELTSAPPEWSYNEPRAVEYWGRPAPNAGRRASGIDERIGGGGARRPGDRPGGGRRRPAGLVRAAGARLRRVPGADGNQRDGRP